MRVLAICYEDPDRILGGMGRHVRELYRTMAERDDVTIDLLTDGEGDGPVEYMDYVKHHTDKLVCWKPRKPDFACLLAQDIQMARTLSQLLAQGKRWDVVHTHEWTSMQVARMARDALSVPLIGTMHLCLTRLTEVENPDWAKSVEEWGEVDFYMRQQEGNLICDPDELILCSQAYIDMAREVFLTKRDVNLIYNGINTVEWNPGNGDGPAAKKEYELDPARPIALYVGRIATMKGIEDVLDAAEAEDTGWQIVLVGEVNANSKEDQEEWFVTKRIRALEAAHPERLRWTGFKHGKPLRDLYAAASCVLMPSRHEPFGIVALEAMAMGVPLLATEVDGLGEIVNGSDGSEYALIINPRSPQEVNDGLKVLKDAAVRSSLRELGLRRVGDFTWEHVVDQTLEVYRRAMKRKQIADIRRQLRLNNTESVGGVHG